MRNDLTLFKDFWSDSPSSILERRNLFDAMPEGFEKILNGKCDFSELDDCYEIELEVPGVKKKEIDINLLNDVLTISWFRKRESKKGLLKRNSFERREGSFTRSFSVAGANGDDISAKLDSGVLKINLPKAEDFKPRRIHIN